MNRPYKSIKGNDTKVVPYIFIIKILRFRALSTVRKAEEKSSALLLLFAYHYVAKLDVEYEILLCSVFVDNNLDNVGVKSLC